MTDIIRSRNFTIGLTALSMLAVTLTLMNGCSRREEKAQGEEKPHEAAFLLVQSSDSFE